MGGANAWGTTTQTGTGTSFEVPRALHESAWLCQVAVTVDDLTTSEAGGLQCKVSLAFTDTMVTVTSTGIPNHDFESGGGCCAAARSLTNRFPLRPELATAVAMAPERGATGIAVNGAELYGPEDADDQDVVRVTYSSPTAQPRLEMCDAHSAPSGAFHYHADANCIHWHGSGDYEFSKVDATKHSGILAFAFDGFPIYGSHGHDAAGQVKEMKSSYRLKPGATGSQGIDDHEYVAGLGDLDECNGHTGPTPEFLQGIYHYHSTMHNGAGDLGFPYFPHCYKGVAYLASGGAMGSTGGSGSPQQPGPAPSGSAQPSGSMPPPPSGSCPPPPSPGAPPPSSPPPSGCPRPSGAPP